MLIIIFHYFFPKKLIGNKAMFNIDGTPLNKKMGFSKKTLLFKEHYTIQVEGLIENDTLFNIFLAFMLIFPKVEFLRHCSVYP